MTTQLEPEAPHPHPQIEADMVKTAITLVSIIVVAGLAFLGFCLPSRSNQVPAWVRRLRHWANTALDDFIRLFPEFLDGPLQRFSTYLIQLRQHRREPRP